MEKKIVVIGMGYVGIPCAVLLADVKGFDVTGVQRRSARSGWKIECLNSGKNPFEGEEPGLSELIARVVKKGSFRVTDDISICREADTILIDVQTPTDENRIPQYLSLRQSCAGVGKHMKKGVLVVIESTVAPGTTQNIVRPILEENSGLKAGEHFHLAFSYERVMPGKLIEYIVNLPRVVGGIDEKSTELTVELYRHIVKAEISPTGCLAAELAKTVENAYRDVNIAFANEMALVCENLGVDVFKLREIINSRHDRHMHLPGTGVGGHCLPKDTWLLRYGLAEYGLENTETDLIALARKVNDSMPIHTARLVERALAEKAREVAGSRVAILGVAYLEDSDDTRNTPALPLIAALQTKEADLIAHDPYVKRFPELTIPLTDSLEQALKGADCAAIVTKHKSYYQIDMKWARKLMRTPVIVDGRNVLAADKVKAAGFLYRGIGKG